MTMLFRLDWFSFALIYIMNAPNTRNSKLPPTTCQACQPCISKHCRWRFWLQPVQLVLSFACVIETIHKLDGLGLHSVQ